MNQEEFVAALNEDLSSEFLSIVQYVQHIATVSGPEFQSIADELKVHLTEELNHAQVLAEQVSFLGGIPTMTVPNASSETDTRSALKLDLELEQRQLERYRERTEQAMALGLPDVSENLRPLLSQTQEHVRDLQAALGS